MRGRGGVREGVRAAGCEREGRSERGSEGSRV